MPLSYAQAMAGVRSYQVIRLCSMIALSLTLGSSATKQTLDGFWRSEGYGYVFETKGDLVNTFEVTTRTCLPSFTAKRETSRVPGVEATFRTKDGDLYFVKPDGAVDQKLLHNEGAASDVRIDRLAKLPPECDRFTPNTPMENFEVFTRTWAEHYISFDLKHANWDTIVAENRTKVTTRTTPVELFEVLKAMIEPFGDAHTSINTLKLKLRFHGIRRDSDRVVRDLVGNGGFDQFQKTGVPRLLAITDRAYIRGRVRKFCGDQLQFGHINTATGYLRISSFADYSKHSGFAEGLLALDAALDEIFSDSTLKALVGRRADQRRWI